jgi:hypothetical protein
MSDSSQTLIIGNMDVIAAKPSHSELVCQYQTEGMVVNFLIPVYFLLATGFGVLVLDVLRIR